LVGTCRWRPEALEVPDDGSSPSSCKRNTNTRHKMQRE
jgi:hypothetical protein